MKEITVKELNSKLDILTSDEMVIDVRTLGEFKEMRINHSEVVNVELNELLTRYEDYANKTLYLVCNSGNRSGMAQMILTSKGIDSYNVVGGMMSWLQNNYPTLSDYSTN